MIFLGGGGRKQNTGCGSSAAGGPTGRRNSLRRNSLYGLTQHRLAMSSPKYIAPGERNDCLVPGMLNLRKIPFSTDRVRFLRIFFYGFLSLILVCGQNDCLWTKNLRKIPFSTDRVRFLRIFFYGFLSLILVCGQNDCLWTNLRIFGGTIPDITMRYVSRYLSHDTISITILH